MATTAAITPDLLDAVEQVVERYGWAGATAELIAKAAGINRTTLYRRGLTKEQLLAEAATAASAEFQGATLAPLTSPGTARERLDQLLIALFDLADRHLGLLAGLYDSPTALFHLDIESSDDIETSDPTASTRLEYTEPFARILRDGVADGTLTSPDPSEDGELIFNTAGWTYIHFRRSHGWSPSQARPAVSRITTAAFLTSPPPTKP